MKDLSCISDKGLCESSELSNGDGSTIVHDSLSILNASTGS
jgi:hypothetical protein